jgi:hypothetical protein
MSEDIIKERGVLKSAKDDRGGANLIPSAVLGIVKNNVDPTRAGRIQVYLKRQESGNQNEPSSWTTVSYISPFFGSTPNTGSPDSAGTFEGNPHSYGFWATPPDIGTEVICVFLNGLADSGYYIGCVPQPGLTHMVPAIASSDNIIANGSEAESYGGATKLPVGEINNANKKQNNSPTLATQPRPVHSYQAAILNKQGLIRDPVRGTISSSSMRETPSRVFGISTPGRPIYEGGYDDSTIADAVKNESTPDKNFKVTGRRGGHSLVMDDGDLTGQDQLVRIRTSMGHMIMMNDTNQTLFIVHANGQSYIELGKEGTIDMYSTNSVNIRTQGDLNLHADNDINIHATKNLNISAENIKTESTKDTSHLTGGAFKQQTKGDHTLKVGSKMSLASAGDSSMASGGSAFINGSKVNLNTGSTSLTPIDVKNLPQVAHTDTLYDSKKGYAAAPGKLQSITSRAPAHSPWASAGQGVNVKSNLSSDANFPAAPSSQVSKANAAAPSTPKTPTSPSITATVPNTQAASPTMNKATTSALVSQKAVDSASGPAADVVAKGAGVVTTDGQSVATVGATGLNPNQLEEAGHIKPGSAAMVNGLISQGAPIEQALSKNVWTGKDGIRSLSQFTGDVGAQVNATVDVFGKAESALKSLGAISGKESSIQTAGLVLSAATVGIDKTLNFLKSSGDSGLGLKLSDGAAGAVGTLSGLAGGGALGTSLADAGSKLTSAIGGLGLKLPTGIADASGSVQDLMAGGKLAAGLADQSTNPLSGLPVTDQLKGLAAGAFSKVTAGFKALKAGVPQNLTTIAAQNNEDKAKEDAAGESQTPEQKAASVSLNQKLTNALGFGEGGSVKATLSGIGDSIKSATSNLSNPSDIMSSASTAILGAANKLGINAGDMSSGLSGLPGGAASVGTLVSLGTQAKSLLGSVSSSSGSGSEESVFDPNGTNAQLEGNSALNRGLSKAFGVDQGGALRNALEGAGASLQSVSGAINVPGMPSVPGIPNIPGVGSITGALNGIAGLGATIGAAMGSLGNDPKAAIAGLKDKLSGGASSLQSLASTGLGAGDLAKLSGSINALGAGGPVEVKLPTIATDTMDFGPMMAQAKALLGGEGSKIPGLSFGSMPAGAFKIPTAAQGKEYDRLKEELTKQEDLQWDLRKQYYDLREKSGPDSDATIAANSVWKQCCQKIETIKQDMTKAVS